MRMKRRPKEKQTSRAPAGEAFVWLTSLGLSVGLFMIAVILLLIVYQGFAAFWPREVVQVTMTDASNSRISDSQIFAGEIVKKQTKKTLSRSTEGMKAKREWQLFVGNKDVYGFSFFYLDVDGIESVKYPKNIVSIEREEYGKAIVSPLMLYVKGQLPMPADAPEFDQQFHTLLREIGHRRKTIKKIEKIQIGKINQKMEKIRLRLRGLEQAQESGNTDDVEEFRNLQEKKASLQAEYETLAEKAYNLRQLQDDHELEYRLITGEERRISLGKLVDYSYPNRLNIVDKFHLFVQNLWKFISQAPREANTEGGIFPAIFGTFVMTLIMTLLVTPFGVMAAIYLTEYAKQGVAVRTVRIAVNNLAGVPSIVFGVFGLGFFVYFVGGTIDQLLFTEALPTPTFGTGGILWASFTLALLTVPVVIVATEEGLAAVPRGMREGGLACGASKWQCIQRIILPAAAPGILTGVVLSMARGAGEVAPLMLVGVVKLAPTLPINTTYPFFHFEQKFMHLGFHIYDLGFQSPDSEAAKPMVFATTFLLIVLIVMLNLTAIFVREKLRRKYAISPV